MHSPYVVDTPIYFITRPDEANFLPADLPSTGVICPNLTYLGECGMREINGILVAYFAGTRDASNKPDYNAQEVEKLLSRSRAASFAGCDVLLSNHWSRGMLSNLKDVAVVGLSTTEQTSFGSVAVAELVEALTPRYHFSASPSHVAFERAPFSHEAPNRPATRFIGLSEAFNPRKAKFMYAFSAAPLRSLPSTEVLALPPGTTDSPFAYTRAEVARDQANSKKRRFDDLEAADASRSNQTFFDPQRAQRGQAYHERQEARARQAEQRAEEQKAFQERRQQTNERVNREASDPSYNGADALHRERHQQRPRTEYSRPRFDRNDPNMKKKIHPLMQRNGCWFCLSNPSVEEHLVVSVGEHNYLAMAKGGLTQEHLLLVPIEHSASLDASQSSPAFVELQNYQRALTDCYAKRDMDLIYWERKLDSTSGHVTSDKNHAALQTLALPKIAFKDVQAGFDAQLEHFGLIFMDLQPDQTVSSVAGQSGYLFLDMPPLAAAEGSSEEAPKRRRLIAIIPDKKRVPLQLPRRVIAQALGVPEREDWKACSMSRDEEDTACSNVKEEFGPFDFTLTT